MRNSASKSVVSGRHASGCVAVAGAGILVLSLVTVPPHVVGGIADVRAVDVRAVQLTGFALAPDASAAAMLKTLIRTPIAVGGPTDIKIKAARTSPTSIPAIRSTAVTPQAVNDLAIGSRKVNSAATEPPVLNFEWLGKWFESTPDFLKGVFFFAVALPVFLFTVYVYDPIAKTINVVLGALGLPLLPVGIPDWSTTSQANETIVAVGTDNTLSSKRVAPQAKSGTPSDLPLSTATGAPPVQKPLATTAPEAGEMQLTRTHIRTLRTPPTTRTTETGQELPTNTGASAGRRLSASVSDSQLVGRPNKPVALRPIVSDSPAKAGPRPNAFVRPGDADRGTPAASRAKVTKTGETSLSPSWSARTTPGSTSPASNSHGSSSSGGDSVGSK
ncbi:MAG TPA: hypothetical protein VH496_17965 [Mycobacterium sp.]|jgi:hypothetical protein